jgi:hypothetical protein
MVTCSIATDTNISSTIPTSGLVQMIDQLYEYYTNTSIETIDIDVPIIKKSKYKPVMNIGNKVNNNYKKKKEIYHVCARRRIA